NRFQNGTPGIVLYPQQSENQRPGPPFVDGVEPEREDLRVVTARDGHRRLGVLEAGLAELGAAGIEGTARQVVHASRGIGSGCAAAIGPPPQGLTKIFASPTIEAWSAYCRWRSRRRPHPRRRGCQSRPPHGPDRRVSEAGERFSTQ